MTRFSKIDLKKANYQIPVEEEHIEKQQWFGLFEFVQMPFGLRNAGQAFQRLHQVIHQVFERIGFLFSLYRLCINSF